ncbi:MAG: hypothetical protein LBV44_03865 [Methylobacillus sp.]|jgi:type IV pilus assembly protein PilX|nr:hypothetical protein [Methylobacillus sp.]
MMNARLLSHNRSAPHQKQRGIALLVVLIIVMLSTLLVLWAGRTAIYHEVVIGNDADYQRAFEAAQSLLQDAELDIRSEKANGDPCIDEAAGTICRKDPIYYFPASDTSRDRLLIELTTDPSGNRTLCYQGICAKRAGRQDFWNCIDATCNPTQSIGEATLANMLQDAAHYGQYTFAKVGNAGLNPLLTLKDNDARPNKDGYYGYYWVEVIPYQDLSNAALMDTTSTTKPLEVKCGGDQNPCAVYRITALAYGHKANTMVVLQESYIPRKETGN